MRAMVLTSFGAPLEARRIDRPTAGPGEVVIRVRACGVCSTDLKVAAGAMLARPGLPHVMGHEPAGEIVEIGPDVVGPQLGDRVAVTFYRPCRDCALCRSGLETSCENAGGQVGFTADGGYAEYLAVPAQNTARLEPHVGFAEGAVIADAVATVVQGMGPRAGLRAGETVLVVGTGGLGLHAVQYARLGGARVIAVDLDEAKLDLARDLGADVVLNAASDGLAGLVRAAAGGGVDLTVDFVGASATLGLCLDSVASGGRLLSIGYDLTKTVELPLGLVVGRQLSLIGSRAATVQTFRDTVALVNAGRLRPLVTDLFPLDAANDVLRSLRAGELVARAVLEIG